MVLARPEGLRYTERENERRIPMKKTVISFLMAGLLLIGMPALAQEGDLPVSYTHLTLPTTSRV